MAKITSVFFSFMGNYMKMHCQLRNKIILVWNITFNQYETVTVSEEQKKAVWDINICKGTFQPGFQTIQ